MQLSQSYDVAFKDRTSSGGCMITNNKQKGRQPFGGCMIAKTKKQTAITEVYGDKKKKTAMREVYDKHHHHQVPLGKQTDSLESGSVETKNKGKTP